MKKKYLLFLLFIFSVISCKSKINLDSIIENNKIIFLGEEHTIVNPRFYLIENLSFLYEKGVRHICMEGFTLRDDSQKDYSYYCFFPWINNGSKYEDVYLSKKILEINSTVPDKEKIIIHDPEKNISDNDIYDLEFYDKLNKRDEASYAYIEELCKEISDNEKILIFYGYKHGSKKNIKNWEPLGHRLSQNHNDFISINFNYSLNKKNMDNVGTIMKSLPFGKYDYYIEQVESPTYGIPYQYYFTKQNANVLIRRLLQFEKNSYSLFEGSSFNHLSDEREYINDIYYLKMMFGDLFDYSFWYTEKSLIEALLELDKYVQNIDNSDFPVNSDNAIRKYVEYMVNSGIEDFIKYNERLDLSYSKEMIEKAYSYYKDDVWCLYWLASIEYELKEYENSIINFEKCLEYKTINNIEVLPKIYDKLSVLYKEMDNDLMYNNYQIKLHELSKESITKVESLIDMR